MGRAYHQEQLSKLLTVLKQAHHDAQQLLLETAARNHPCGRQLKKQGKDCVQPWPESNIPEIMANKSESKQNPAIQHRDEEHESPCPQRHQGYLIHHEVFPEKVRKNISSCLTNLHASIFLDHRRLNHCMIPYFRNLKLKFECQNVFNATTDCVLPKFGLLKSCQPITGQMIDKTRF